MMAMAASIAVTPERISERLVLVRGEQVLLDSDLAALYAVSTKRLNEQVRRNRERFPSDFVFCSDQSRGCRFEVAKCDLKQNARTRRAAVRPTCIYRAWSLDGS
jgi:hypothetical protein